MDTLSKLGRYEICKRVGITNENSIFVTDKNAFIDRMQLYNGFYNITKFIDIYKSELNKFASEEGYVSNLRNREKLLYSIIRKNIIKANLYEVNFLDRSIEEIMRKTSEVHKHFKETDEERCLMNIYFNSPVYEAYKFLCLGTVDTDINLYDYVYGLTHSEFIASMDDLDISKIDGLYNKSVIRAYMNALSSKIVSNIGHKYINENQIVDMGLAKVSFEVPSNKSVSSINKIKLALQNSEYDLLINSNIEIVKYSSLAKNNDIKRKFVISCGNNRGKYDIVDYDQISLISYLRKIKNEQFSKYDDYIDIGGNELKITQKSEIDWY